MLPRPELVVKEYCDILKREPSVNLQQYRTAYIIEIPFWVPHISKIFPGKK